MEQKVRKFLKENHLIQQKDRIVLGVSGGADSVCMLHLLWSLSKEMDLTLYVVHINHEIRGEDANQDEEYVKKLCQQLKVHFTSIHCNVMVYAKNHGLSSEEAGRVVRYQAFYEESHKFNCSKIAIAHNMNDTAETVLFHLMRGSGIKGLTGIPILRQMEEGIQIVRPILCLKREEIESYLRDNNLSYQIDATNLTDEYSRNKVRNQILPFAKKEINQRVIEHISNTAIQLSEINAYVERVIDSVYHQYVKEKGMSVVTVNENLLREDIVIQKGVIRKLLSMILKDGLKDIVECHTKIVLELLTLQVGKMVNLPGGLCAKRGYEEIEFSFRREEKNTENTKKINLVLDITKSKEYDLGSSGKTLKMDVINYKKSMIIPKNLYTKWFDYDKIKNTVFIRTREPGDYIQVNESGGKKKLKDYFIDRKIPKEVRDEYLLLADGKHIMWIFEDRISEGYKVDENTKRILTVSIIGGNV